MHFKEINDLFEHTGFQKRTDIPEFFILKFSEISESSVYAMPPYQKDFYQITFIKNADDAQIKIDQQAPNNLKNTVSFLSPDHFYSWVRGGETQGYIIYFKSNFLNLFRGKFKETFSYFDLASSNTLVINDDVLNDFEHNFNKLHQEFHTKSLYRIQILQSFLLSFLFKIKGTYEEANQLKNEYSKNKRLVIKYRNLVNSCYSKEKNVNYYAKTLHISANYLNQIIKNETGKSAKYYIQQKLVLEAKKLLEYSQLDISEIAFHLGYEEPTHFSRFFKSQTEVTPKTYRNRLL